LLCAVAVAVTLSQAPGFTPERVCVLMLTVPELFLHVKLKLVLAEPFLRWTRALDAFSKRHVRNSLSDVCVPK
jgi:hypothetical protein